MKEDYEITGLEMDTLAEPAQRIDGCLGGRNDRRRFRRLCHSSGQKISNSFFRTEYVIRRYNTVTGLTCEIYPCQAHDGDVGLLKH
jgi:galactokinase